MSLLLNDADINKVSQATSQLIKDAIGEVATVLVPAIAEATKNALAGVNMTVTIGPITVAPIDITVKVE